jgi:isopenicillin N synthase-like dioxygenase
MQKNNEEPVTIDDVPIIDLMAWHNAPDKKADEVIAACQ